MHSSFTGAVVRTALFILMVSPVLFPSCKGGSGKKSQETAIQPVAADTNSLTAIDKLIRENPKNPDLFAKRAQLFGQQKNYTQALNDISIALSLDSLKPAYFISQAEYYLYIGQPNSAKKGLNTCLKKFPGNTDVMIKLAEIHMYLKEYGQAKMILKDVLPINDDLAQIYFIQGLIALETNDTLGAVKNFQVTIEKEPDFYAAYVQAGKIYASQSNELAIQYLKSAIDLQPDMYEAHYLLGLFYQDHGYLDEAHQEYEFISSKLDSTRPDPYFNRGYIEMVYKKNFKEAADWFSKAIQWNPAYADAWYNRGFSYELDGQLKKAREDYQKAMEIEPNYPLAIKGLNRIEEGKPIKNR